MYFALWQAFLAFSIAVLVTAAVLFQTELLPQKDNIAGLNKTMFQFVYISLYVVIAGVGLVFLSNMYGVSGGYVTVPWIIRGRRTGGRMKDNSYDSYDSGDSRMDKMDNSYDL